MTQRSERTDPRVARSRDVVLAATLALLTERGVAGTTVEAVAQRSGVAKTTIYRQWDGQAALVHAAFSSAVAAPPDPDTGTLRGDLVEVLGGFAEALSASPMAPLLPALMDMAERDPAFAVLHHEQAQSRHEPALRAIRRGVARGELPPTVDPATVLDLLAGAVLHRRYMTAVAPDRAFAERVVDQVLKASGA